MIVLKLSTTGWKVLFVLTSLSYSGAAISFLLWSKAEKPTWITDEDKDESAAEVAERETKLINSSFL